MTHKGFTAGVLFGTFGLFILTFMMEFVPVLQTLIRPFLLPGMFMARILLDGAEPNVWTIFILYLLTAVMYGLIGHLIQYLYAHFHSGGST